MQIDNKTLEGVISVILHDAFYSGESTHPPGSLQRELATKMGAQPLQDDAKVVLADSTDADKLFAT